MSCERGGGFITSLPSEQLFLPPEILTIYGLFVSGCMQLSLRDSSWEDSCQPVSGAVCRRYSNGAKQHQHMQNLQIGLLTSEISEVLRVDFHLKSTMWITPPMISVSKRYFRACANGCYSG